MGDSIPLSFEGMGLLDDNGKLSRRCEELSDLYESMRNELEITKEALSKVNQTQKIATISGLQHEESLLSENAALECSLNSQILDLELELKAVKQELGKIDY